MNNHELKKLIMDILEEKQVEDIISFEKGIGNIANIIIIASGRSLKNISAIAEYLSLQIKNQLKSNVTVEGMNSKSGWVLVNTDEIIVHLFIPEIRAYYNLEEFYNTYHFAPLA